MLGRISLFFYGASLATLPLAGVGLLVLLTGRDWGFGLQPSWVFLYLAIAFALAERILRGQGGSVPAPAGFPPVPVQVRRVLVGGMILVLVAIVVSGLGILWAPAGETRSGAWGRFARQGVQLLIMLGFVVWPALWTRGSRRWRFTLKMMMAGVLLQVGYGLLQEWHFFRPGVLLPALERIFTSNPAILSGSETLYLGNTFQDVPRLRGTMCEPLYLGNFILMAVPWLVWGRRWWRGLRWLAAVCGLLLLLTWSRGAWLGFLVQVSVLAGLLVRRVRKGKGVLELPDRRILLLGILGLLLLAAAFAFSGWQVFQLPRDRLVQTFSTRDWSNLTRLYSMQAAWRAFLLSPLVGVGWGQYSFHFPRLVDPLGLQSQFSWPVVNNFPLKILCETGIQGFLVFLVLGAALLREGWRRVMVRDSRSYKPVLAGLVAVVGVWIQLLSFSQYNLPHIWLAVGLLLAALFDDSLPDPGREDAGIGKAP